MSRSATARDSGTLHRDPAQPHARTAEHNGVDVTAPGRSSAAAGATMHRDRGTAAAVALVG
jgi:hypothetical protein